MLAQASTQGQTEDEEELPGPEMTQWMKARDKLCDQLKYVARYKLMNIYESSIVLLYLEEYCLTVVKRYVATISITRNVFACQ